MPRLFTGLELPPSIASLLSTRRGGLPGARWIEPSDYHITLRFIGDIDEGLARDVAGTLSLLRPRAPVPVMLDGLASFGGDKPRALFAHVAPSPALIELQSEQESLMRRLGLPPEGRKFTPHVTLARLRHTSPLDVAEYIAAQGFMQTLRFEADRVILYSSKASTGGGPYLKEDEYPFVRGISSPEDALEDDEGDMEDAWTAGS